MAVQFGVVLRDAVCEQLRARASGAVLEIWSDINFNGLKLVSLTLGDPAFNAPNNGVMTATTIPPSQVLITGAPVAWRIIKTINNTPTLLLKGTVGGLNSSADWTLAELQGGSTTLVQGQPFTVNSFVYSAPL
jgi:hypothetical protein